MYPAGLTYRVGGCPDGGKDLTCSSWRGIATHNDNEDDNNRHCRGLVISDNVATTP